MKVGDYVQRIDWSGGGSRENEAWARQFPKDHLFQVHNFQWGDSETGTVRLVGSPDIYSGWLQERFKVVENVDGEE